jgi:hypothetical protein
MIKVVLGFMLVLSTSVMAERLINGTPVPEGTFKEVVKIRTGSSGCTATIVGPRAIITAAHCARNGATSTFTVNGKGYGAKITRHPRYPGPVDIAMGVINEEVKGIVPVQLDDRAAVIDDMITLLGYGCTNPGGGGGNDGVLRYGESKVISVKGNQGFDVTSYMKGGAAVCYGDSGGPAYRLVDGIRGKFYYQIGVNSRGNIKSTNYNIHLMADGVHGWIKGWAESKGVEVCGVTMDCVKEPDPDQFEMENDAVMIRVVSKGIHPVDYLKNAFEMLLNYLVGDTE